MLEARLVLSNQFIPLITPYIPAVAGNNLVPAPGSVAPAVPASVAPGAPFLLTATSTSDTSITLTWQRPDNNDQNIVIQRKTEASGSYSTLAVLPAHSDVYTDTSCYPSTTYFYQVVAENTFGTSAPSPARSAMTQTSAATLLSPGLQVTAKNSFSVSLTVNDTNPYVARNDLAVDATNAKIVFSGSQPFTASDVGRTLSVTGVGWWYLTVLPTSNGSVVYDQHSPFTASNVGETLYLGGGTGWNQGTYQILAVDNQGHATLDAPATSSSNTATANGSLGWSSTSMKIVSVDAQGRATLSTAATFAGNPNAITASIGTPFNSGNYLIERSTDGRAYQIVQTVANASSVETWTDSELTPGQAYTYRVRLNTWYGTSDYTAPVSVTIPASPAGIPPAPTCLSVMDNSATSDTLTWTDNSGGTASFTIQRAVFSWTGSQTWVTVGTTSPGVTSYTDNTVATKSFYDYRVFATGPGGNSANTPAVVLRTSSPGTGSPKVYKIGPGQMFPTLDALNWSSLGPGDVVDIYPNKDASGSIVPYPEKLLIAVRGTAAAPIQVVGVPDPATGALPIIDGTNATTNPQFATSWTPLENYGVVIVGTASNTNAAAGWNPGYLDISNLEIRGGYEGDNGGKGFTNSQGQFETYSSGSAGIYLEMADHLTISGCNVHGNDNGIFGAAQGDQRDLSNIIIDNNFIHADGNPNSYLFHEIYLEGIDVTYEHNRIGPTHGGGDALKDRGVGTVIIGNWITGGGHLIDLVEAQNDGSRAMIMPAYNETYVAGNVLYNPSPTAGGSVSPINYGGDQGDTLSYRKGVLYFYDNTFVTQSNQSQVWATTLFRTDSSGEAVDVRDNVIVETAATPGSNASEMDLLPSYGVAYFGTNWVSPNWQESRAGLSFTGVATGTGSFVTTPGNATTPVDLNALNLLMTTGLSGPSPTAMNDTASTPFATPVTVAVLANDTDPRGNSFGVVSVTQGKDGSVLINPNGTLTYTPYSGFSGADSFSYTIANGHGGTAGATVSITVGTPSTVLAGFVFVDTNGNGIMSANDPTSFGDPVAYSGITTQGQIVSGLTTTDSTGAYRFVGLPPGTYSVKATVPSSYLPGLETKGGVVQPGSSSNAPITNITLSTNGLSTGNDFGLLKPPTMSPTPTPTPTPPASSSVYYANSSQATLTTGGSIWRTGWGGGFQGNFFWIPQTPNATAAAATWTIHVATPGTYAVYATWVAAPSPYYSNDSPYTVLDGTKTLATTKVNQWLEPSDMKDNGDNWQLLGTYTFTGTSVVVRLTNNADGRVLADGIRVAQVAAPALQVATISSAAKATVSTAYAAVAGPVTSSTPLPVTVAPQANVTTHPKAPKIFFARRTPVLTSNRKPIR